MLKFYLFECKCVITLSWLRFLPTEPAVGPHIHYLVLPSLNVVGDVLE